MPTQEVTPKVTFGNINPGTMMTETVMSLFDARHVFHKVMFHIAGPYLDVGRNCIVHDFWADETFGDFLLFADSDIVFTPKDVTDLLAVARPDRIVAGVYMNNFPARKGLPDSGGVRPVAGRFKYDPELKADIIMPIDPSELSDTDSEGLIKVDGCGAGFLMFHRQLVNEMMDTYGMPMPWFLCQVISTAEQWYGEDYMFNLRANAIGYPTYIVPSVRVGHKKYVRL